MASLFLDINKLSELNAGDIDALYAYCNEMGISIEMLISDMIRQWIDVRLGIHKVIRGKQHD